MCDQLNKFLSRVKKETIWICWCTSRGQCGAVIRTTKCIESATRLGSLVRRLDWLVLEISLFNIYYIQLLIQTKYHKIS